MKIRTGGGGVDANGKTYKLPEEEIEVPDDFFLKMWEALIKSSQHVYDCESPAKEQ